MMKLASFLKLVRFPNLAIVALTQYLMQYLVLVPALKAAGLSPNLSPFDFTLLVLTTVFIAAGGYLINDLLDYEADLINKPDSVFVNRVFAEQTVWFFYWASILISFATAWYLDIFRNKLPMVAIQMAIVSLLYFYSRWFKKMPLIGNLAVAIFCALVAVIVPFADWENLAEMKGLSSGLASLLIGYTWFAFASTLLREIVKDMEDIEGDARLGLNTLPIRFGERTAKKWAIGVGVALLFSLLWFVLLLVQRQQFISAGFTVVGVGVPLAYLLNSIQKANKKTDYSKASRMAKTLMLLGLILLVVCKMAS
jgi:4-hydroxybenzoate polyprenyltransferase